jgi:dephospho-CoA kinase
VSRLILGVTGNTASGKSLVAQLFREKGCALIDADKIAHGLYASNPSLVRQITLEFGDDVLHPDGSLNRKRLGQRVFGDPLALAALNRIVHPHLLIELREQILTTLKVMNNVVVDAALIVEWGIQREFDHLVMVTSPAPQRLIRLMERDGLSRDEAEARIRSQMPEEEKRKSAEFVIENDGDEEGLRGKVDAVWADIVARQNS